MSKIRLGEIKGAQGEILPQLSTHPRAVWWQRSPGCDPIAPEPSRGFWVPQPPILQPQLVVPSLAPQQ